MEFPPNQGKPVKQYEYKQFMAFLSKVNKTSCLITVTATLSFHPCALYVCYSSAG